ncbi:hypothetical protein [Moorella stamsii]|uniref:hypothetical protein n=1 Tax=Neomoorella stamsii TaxID=1266720 RepID=UPI001379FC83|nr:MULTISPECIES: hypothetical protein [Moorella]
MKKTVGHDGSIAIDEALKMAKIRPGDLVEIIPATNKIIIRVVNKRQQEGVVRAVAGKWKDRRDLVDDLLKIREGRR